MVALPMTWRGASVALVPAFALIAYSHDAVFSRLAPATPAVVTAGRMAGAAAHPMAGPLLAVDFTAWIAATQVTSIANSLLLTMSPRCGSCRSRCFGCVIGPSPPSAPSWRSASSVPEFSARAAPRATPVRIGAATFWRWPAACRQRVSSFSPPWSACACACSSTWRYPEAGPGLCRQPRRGGTGRPGPTISTCWEPLAPWESKSSCSAMAC